MHEVKSNLKMMYEFHSDQIKSKRTKFVDDLFCAYNGHEIKLTGEEIKLFRESMHNVENTYESRYRFR